MKTNKIKNFLSNCVKGIAIGVSMIIPGFSGGTIAVLMNIYDKLLEAVTGIFKNFKKSILFLLPIIIGAVLGFVGLVVPLEYGLSHIPLIIVSLFVGLIIGGIPFIYKKVQGKENLVSIIVGVLAMALTISLCFIKGGISIDFSSLNVGSFLYLILAGALASIALVAPGISGSMTLMVLGVYTTIITSLKEILSFENLVHNALLLIPLAIGLVVGFFLMSMLMKYLLQKHTTSTYFAILGFIIGSIVTIYYVTITDEQYPVVFDAPNIIFSVITLIVGVVAAFLVEHIASKKVRNIEEKEGE